MGAFAFQSDPTGLAVRVICQKNPDLPFEHALLDGREQLLGFSERQAQMLDP
jgi:hypothetical protein